jgi:hypothetical protein
MTLLHKLAKLIRDAILSIHPPAGSGRPSTHAVYKALKRVRPVIEHHFGGPVYCRYSGCPKGPATSYSVGGHSFKVLEYLWDFSFSRFAIPQAIEAPETKPVAGGKYELLLVAESEMGTEDEICRDLLKLLEARTVIRCLVYRQPKRPVDRQKFQARMIRVLHNHAQFQRCPGLWLFVALTWSGGNIACDLYTINEDLNAFSPLLTA